MKRDLSFEEISDGKLYKADDLARVNCNGCVNCSECCEVTEDTILLDPYDAYSLSEATGKSFENLLGEFVDLTVVDGVITPYLKKNAGGACVFLENGRCKIHAFRPGFCRMFPLGRIYDDNGDFSYFIQVHECPYESKSKIKVKQWLNIPSIQKYEAYIKEWHKVILSLRNAKDPKADNLKVLNLFFIAPYSSDFYKDFYERLKALG